MWRPVMVALLLVPLLGGCVAPPGQGDQSFWRGDCAAVVGASFCEPDRFWLRR